MRFDITTTIIARLATANVREICDVVFGGSMRLHQWLASEPLGKSSYSGSVIGASSLGDESGRIEPNQPGCKRGNLQLLAVRPTTATCPAGFATA